MLGVGDRDWVRVGRGGPDRGWGGGRNKGVCVYGPFVGFGNSPSRRGTVRRAGGLGGT